MRSDDAERKDGGADLGAFGPPYHQEPERNEIQQWREQKA
jgi:hypothetical protein